MDITQYFVSLAALVPLVVLITDFLVRWIKIEKSWVKQVLSWVVSLVLCGIGVFFDIGFLANLPVFYIFIYGFALGLVSNGFFDIKVIQTVLNFILNWINKKQP